MLTDGYIEQLTALLCQQLRKRPGEWLGYKALCRVIFGNDNDELLVGALADFRRDLFAVHADRRLKLKRPEYYNSSISLPKVNAVAAPTPSEYWVYIAEWDVYYPGSGPYRAVLHRQSCNHVANRKHKEEGVGYKNYWRSFDTLEDAVRFSADLYPWHHCPHCFSLKS